MPSKNHDLSSLSLCLCMCAATSEVTYSLLKEETGPFQSLLLCRAIAIGLYLVLPAAQPGRSFHEWLFCKRMQGNLITDYFCLLLFVLFRAQRPSAALRAPWKRQGDKHSAPWSFWFLAGKVLSLAHSSFLQSFQEITTAQEEGQAPTMGEGATAGGDISIAAGCGSEQHLPEQQGWDKCPLRLPFLSSYLASFASETALPAFP